MAALLRQKLSNFRCLFRSFSCKRSWQAENRRMSTRALSATGLLLFGSTSLWLFNRKYNQITAIHALSPRHTNVGKKREDALGKGTSRLTPRERRFVQFASTEFRGQIYMTPQDFLESVIEAEPRPRLKRKILNENDLMTVHKSTPPLVKGTCRTFRDLRDQGIISYTEYLFLLSILTKPKSGFHIAFKMFDTNDNARVDKEEFLVLLGIICQKIFKEDISRGADQQLLEKIFSHAYRDRRGLRLSKDIHQESSEKQVDKEENETNAEDGLQRRNDIDTTLLVHLFGKTGQLELKYEEFCKFMENLQTEVLELEFLEFSKGLATITELDFAKILLRYTQLDLDVYDEYLDRLLERNGDERGITFHEFYNFCTFLNSLDDFTIAMRMYSLADRPISEDEFQRAVKICTGASLSPHVVRTVFLLFDEDGDGRLSEKEFIAIMRDRIHRGLKSYSRNEGWDAFKHCIKQEMKSVL